MNLAYLYSRYPVISQTFCDMEMLELERRGFDLFIGSIHPPLTSLRHQHVERLRSPIHYAPPSPILRVWEKKVKAAGRWPQKLINAHAEKYGANYKAALRARNACYFAELFTRERIDHLHVHFANRAAHTAIFVKAICGIPFSITAHGQDFMSDLGADDLLQEICAAAEFVAVETDYSRDLLRKRCPEAAGKIQRVYNGMDLANFPPFENETGGSRPVRIVSVGRLVEFKGFEKLIEACARLREKQLHFNCSIIGDGPLRERLQRRIAELHLDALVVLRGSLSQEEVFEELRRCDIFALAAIVDRAGASDVFPTVIQEAMASARPVVSTRLAGIPETVVDGQSGLLVESGNVDALARALETLVRDRELRLRFGAAGRKRIEQHFQIETTIAPLVQFFESIEATKSAPAPKAEIAPTQVAYLIDRWPDESWPVLKTELKELERDKIACTGFVFRLTNDQKLSAAMENAATHFEFLPGAMVIEAEWQAHRELVLQLENERAHQSPRAPADLFLEQARCALVLRKAMREKNISHLHATSSRTLICGLLLQKMLGLTLSATIEPKPILSFAFLRAALAQCAGGRISDKKLKPAANDDFMFEPNAPFFGEALRRISGIDLTRSRRFWQEWSKHLAHWVENHSSARKK